MNLADFANFAAFAPVALAVVASPGPDSILILKNALVAGRRAGLLTLAGVQLGVSLHGAAAAAGLSALLYYSPVVFRGVALAGAAYLAWLGLSAVKSGGALDFSGGTAAPRGNFFRQGLFCNLLNPKVIVLFVALFPSFVVHGEAAAMSGAAQIVVLTAILLAINIPVQYFLVAASRWLRGHLARPATARLVQVFLGGVLLFFAAALLVNNVLVETR